MAESGMTSAYEIRGANGRTLRASLNRVRHNLRLGLTGVTLGELFNAGLLSDCRIGANVLANYCNVNCRQ